ncbi:MAG: 4-phosphoerythronate dehydrogenase [Rikenellaceae bacterium]
MNFVKIVIDSAIPFIEGVFEPYAQVVYVASSQITPDVIRDAEAMVVRTRTRCDAQLLDGSAIRHIATATIGYDHIDLEYCRQNTIEVTTAAGCNARGVLQWVGAALVEIARLQGGWQPHQKVLGVVGVGNVGRLTEEYARRWGFKVVCCDPPRAEAEGDDGFVSFEELLSVSDIVTFHTPLDDQTRHMLNRQSVKLLKGDATIINTSRGEVIESEAIASNASHTLAFDVWEGEPNIDLELLQRAAIATPHIAGYSIQGKANATADVVCDIARHFELPIDGWFPDAPHSHPQLIGWVELQQSITEHFNIAELSQTLKKRGGEFEYMRNNYCYREEYF